MQAMPPTDTGSVREWFYVVAAHEADQEIALAEAEALVGGQLRSPRVIVSSLEVDVRRTAFLGLGAELVWCGTEIEGLLAHLRAHPLEAQGFAIDARKWPRRGGPSRQTLCGEIARLIGGKPDLDCPSVLFALVIDDSAIFFGRSARRNDTDWRARTHRPFTFTAAITPQLARAAVNLVTREGEAVVDPCCGSGTIVAEAAAVGVRAAGFDVVRAMPRRARRNARALGVEALFGVADARNFAGAFDAIVTNLPYDIMSPAGAGFYVDFLSNLPRIAPRAAFYCSSDLSEAIAQAGLTLTRLLRRRAHGMTRYLHVVSAV